MMYHAIYYIEYNIIFFNSLVAFCQKNKKRTPRPEGWAGVPKKGGEEHMKNMRITFLGLRNLGVLLSLQVNCNLFVTECQEGIVNIL